MIEFHYLTEFELNGSTRYSDWVSRVIEDEENSLGHINYIICDDSYLVDLNLKYLNHDTLTDIITFDYSNGNQISGDIFISVERVRENAEELNMPFDDELRRVMIHGVLHMLGYGDKTEEDRRIMRRVEEEKMKLFHVEH